jgi:hypothetical protein
VVGVADYQSIKLWSEVSAFNTADEVPDGVGISDTVVYMYGDESSVYASSRQPNLFGYFKHPPAFGSAIGWDRCHEAVMAAEVDGRNAWLSAQESGGQYGTGYCAPSELTIGLNATTGSKNLEFSRHDLLILLDY